MLSVLGWLYDRVKNHRSYAYSFFLSLLFLKAFLPLAATYVPKLNSSTHKMKKLNTSKVLTSHSNVHILGFFIYLFIFQAMKGQAKLLDIETIKSKFFSDVLSASHRQRANFFPNAGGHFFSWHLRSRNPKSGLPQQLQQWPDYTGSCCATPSASQAS